MTYTEEEPNALAVDEVPVFMNTAQVCSHSSVDGRSGLAKVIWFSTRS